MPKPKPTLILAARAVASLVIAALRPPPQPKPISHFKINTTSEFNGILARVRQILLDDDSVDSAQVIMWAESLGPDGRWSDIHYQDRNRALWKTSEHLKRVKALSRLLVSGTSESNPEMEAATMRAIDHWIAKRYQKIETGGKTRSAFRS